MNIQNHFSDTALLSLAELKTRLEQNCKLDARKQREMISAINTTAKWLNLPAEMIPASATFLRGKFKRFTLRTTTLPSGVCKTSNLLS